MCKYIHIYIHRERETERERHTHTDTYMYDRCIYCGHNLRFSTKFHCLNTLFSFPTKRAVTQASSCISPDFKASSSFFPTVFTEALFCTAQEIHGIKEKSLSSIGFKY